jgi:hypothetical protein
MIGQLGPRGGDELMQALEVARRFEKVFCFRLVHDFPLLSVIA